MKTPPATFAALIALCVSPVAAQGPPPEARHRANIEEAIQAKLEGGRKPVVAAAMPVGSFSSESSTHFTLEGVNGVDYALNLPSGVWEVSVSLSGASDYLALWSDNRHWRRATECNPTNEFLSHICVFLLYDDSDRLARDQDDFHVGPNLVWHNFYPGASTLSTAYETLASSFTVTFRRIGNLPAPPFTCSEAESRRTPAPNPDPTPPVEDTPPCHAAGEGVNLDGHQVFMCIVASGTVHQLDGRRAEGTDNVAVFGRPSDPKALVKLVGGCTWGAVAAVTTARKSQIRVYNQGNGREWLHNHNKSGLGPSGYSGDALCD